MSSYEHRISPVSGEESHRVRFRRDGKNVAKTFETEADAKSWQAPARLDAAPGVSLSE